MFHRSWPVLFSFFFCVCLPLSVPIDRIAWLTAIVFFWFINFDFVFLFLVFSRFSIFFLGSFFVFKCSIFLARAFCPSARSGQLRYSSVVEKNPDADQTIWSIDLFPFGVFCEGWKYYIYYSIISISCYKKWKERNSICFFNELFVITFHHTIRSPWKFRGKWSSIHFDRFETASLLLKVMTIFIWTWEIGWSSLNRYFRSILIRKLALRIWFSSSLFTYHYVWSY
jgi:hypothetical protein